MRTTILLSTLLFLAGYALAQDSPIRVGDSSSIPGLPGKKAAPSTQPKKQGKKAVSAGSTFVEYSEFKFDGPGKVHHVSKPGYQAACFDIKPRPGNFTPVSLAGKPWSLDLRDSKNVTVTLMRAELKQDNNPERIQILLDQHQVTARSLAKGGVGLELEGYLLGWATLTVDNVKQPEQPYPTGGSIFISYCKGGVCAQPCQ
jgi:hypothetical protein